jgi:Butirosin biosynthesis protein H, N-terminal/Domain of unknown function (DUF4872)
MIIDSVRPFAGQHCETTTLGVLLGHLGIELSEPMLFGLGEGLGFVYWDSRQMDFPFLGGRGKPMSVATALAARLGLTLRVERTGSPGRAWRHVAAAVDAGTPVGLQLDSYHLDYFTSKVHFGGHVVAMYGYDEAYAYLVDTAQQGGAVRTTLASLAAARAQRGPMAGRHLSFTIGGRPAAPAEALGAAIRATAQAFLHPPIANLGHRGIDTAARRVTGWLDRGTDPARDLPLAAALMEEGGTGGALFRNLYRDFLGECRALVDDDNLRVGHERYAEAAALWTRVAQEITAAGRTCDPAHLAVASTLLREIAGIERAAMRALAEVKA